MKIVSFFRLLPTLPYAKSCALFLVPLLLLIGMIQVATIQISDATPNWTRKYNADCNFCHYPFPPRLNNFGQRFRWTGYRTPAEWNKDQDVTKVSDFLSARVTTNFEYENFKGQLERTEFNLNDATFFYSGAISRNFSGLISPRIANNGDVTITGQLQGVWGNPRQYFSIRGGQMLPLALVSPGGLDRPTGVGLPSFFVTLLTNGGAPLRLISSQKGIEFAFGHDEGRLLVQVLNGVDNTGSGTSRSVDVDTDKDYLVAYHHLFGDVGSSVSGFYYQGTTHDTVTTTPRGIPTGNSSRFDFSRLGLNGNVILQVGDLGYFEVLGGYLRSYDNVPATKGTDKEGNAYWGELQEVLLGPELAFYQRVEFIDQDAARSGSMRKVLTAGAVTRVQTWGRVGVEYTYTDNRDSEVNGTSGHNVVMEFWIAW